MYCIFYVLSCKFCNSVFCASFMLYFSGILYWECKHANKYAGKTFLPQFRCNITKTTVNDKQDNHYCTFSSRVQQRTTHFNTQYLVQLALLHWEGMCAIDGILIHHQQGNMLKAVTRITYYLVKIPEERYKRWVWSWQLWFEQRNVQVLISPRDGDANNHFLDPKNKNAF